MYDDKTIKAILSRLNYIERLLERKADKRLLVTGETPITNNLNMNNYTITNVGSPVNTYDVVNKYYLLSQLSALVFIIDGGGSVITTGEKGHVRLPFDGTIVSTALAADQAGDIVIDIWKDTYANFPPTVADTITASAKPTLSSAQVSLDSTLTGWTKTFTTGDFLAFNIDSCATITRVTLTLTLQRT